MNNAEMLFREIVSKGYEGIKELIGKEETLFLDFKSKSGPEVPGAQGKDKEKLAEAISGFSNSAGGIIVWGIDCRSNGKDQPDVAETEKPIRHLKKFLTDLNHALPTLIFPLTPGIQNAEIAIPDQEDRGFVITFVPESNLTPHRSLITDLYYTRAGSNFVKMEHNMLADMFGRRQRPSLSLSMSIFKVNETTYPTPEGTIKTIDCKILFGIQNDGRYVATYPALKISPKNFRISQYVSSEWLLNDIRGGGPITLEFEEGGTTPVMWRGGISDVIHPTTKLFGFAITKSFNVNDLINLAVQQETLSFDYEIFAEGCQPVYGTSEDISKTKLVELLKLNL